MSTRNRKLSTTREETPKDSSSASKKSKTDKKAPSTSPGVMEASMENEVPAGSSKVDGDIFNANGKRIPKLQIVVQEWRAVANWRWKDADEDDCGICRSPYSACCNDCKFPGEDCPIVVGKCSHRFHIHCIHKWLQSQQQQRQTCPMCRQEWVEATV